jgi:hypothetical protein
MDVKDSCVFYADWLDAAHTIENTALRCCFFEAVLQYALTGMELDTPPELKLAMTIVKNCIDRDRDKYQKKIEKRRMAGRLGGAPIGNQNARKNFDQDEQPKQTNDCLNNQNEQMVTKQADNVNDNVNGNVNVNDNDKDNNDFNTPHIPPKGGRAISFYDFYQRVIEVKVPTAIKEIHYENQYVWRAAEGQVEYMMKVMEAARTKSEPHLQGYIQNLNKEYPTSTPFQMLLLCMAMTKLKTEAQRNAVLEELKRSEKEPDIYKTLTDKVEYIVAGNKVNSLKGFMQSRKD